MTVIDTLGSRGGGLCAGTDAHMSARVCDLCSHMLSLRPTGAERSLMRLSKLCVSPRVGGAHLCVAGGWAYLGGGACRVCARCQCPATRVSPRILWLLKESQLSPKCLWNGMPVAIREGHILEHGNATHTGPEAALPNPSSTPTHTTPPASGLS